MSKKKCSSCAYLSWCHDWYMYNIGESYDEPNAQDCSKYLSQYKYKVICNNNGFEILEKGTLRPRKSNRFCSQECACESLMGEYVSKEDLPLDGDEDEEDV